MCVASASEVSLPRRIATASLTRRGLLGAISLGTMALVASCEAQNPAKTFGLAVSGIDAAALDLAEATATTLGKHLDVLTVYDAFARGAPLATGLLDQIFARGSVPVMTWEPWDPDGGKTQPEYSAAQIAGGRYDSYIATWGKQAASSGRRFLLRFAHEMNGDWYPWAVGQSGTTPEDYVAAYRRVHRIFDDCGAHQVQWVWSPNVIIGANADVISRCYPGDDYVDVIGVDGYNFGNRTGYRWTEPADLFGATFALIEKVAPQKPLWVSEVGCADLGGDKSAWIGALLKFLTATPVRGLVWFEVEADNPGEPDWRLTSSPQTTAAAKLALHAW
jgi:mannan endo-1,4-beta-mannosidase